MEILIPTNDGLNIAPDFDTATSIRSLTVVNGVVRKDSISPAINQAGSHLPTNSISRDPNMHHTVITRGLLPETEVVLKNNSYEVFRTGETIIVTALMHYLNNVALKESNYCCCP